MPNSHTEWDPLDHQEDPERDLTLVIRKLRLGDVITMPSGVVVRSTAVPHGSSAERRFAVVPSEKDSTPKERHRILALGQSTYRTANEAARKALQA